MKIIVEAAIAMVSPGAMKAATVPNNRSRGIKSTIDTTKGADTKVFWLGACACVNSAPPLLPFVLVQVLVRLPGFFEGHLVALPQLREVVDNGAG